MKKKNLYSFSILFLLCLGVFFINRYQTHDWGDDFALYLMQAQKTASFQLQFSTHYLFNGLNPLVAPSFYPPVFSAFLGILYPVLKTDISNYIIVIHLLLLLNILLFWHYLKSKYTHFLVIALCLLWAYNPWILYFKNEVMSEFLFVTFLILFYINYNEKKNLTLLLILGALLISTRSIGWVIIPALLAESFLKKEWRSNLLLCIGIILLSGIINLIFTGQINGANYSSNFKWNEIVSTTLSNIQFYFKHIYNWFIPYLETKSFLILPTQFITLGLLMLGLYSVLKAKKYQIEILFSFFYLALILIYPYQGAGFRFLVPLIPIMLLLLAEAIMFVKNNITNTYLKNVFYYAIPLFFLLQYYPNLNYLITTKNKPDGPYTTEALQAWEALKLNTNPKDTIYFTYPKAQALLTNRYSKAFPEANESKINYFLDDLNSPNNFVKQLKNSRKFDTLWTNKRFTLFKKIE